MSVYLDENELKKLSCEYCQEPIMKGQWVVVLPDNTIVHKRCAIEKVEEESLKVDDLM